MEGPGMRNLCVYSFAWILEDGEKVCSILPYICENRLSKHSFFFVFQDFSRPSLQIPIHDC